MEIKEIEVPKTIKQYTLTEDEYHNLINNNREYKSIMLCAGLNKKFLEE